MMLRLNHIKAFLIALALLSASLNEAKKSLIYCQDNDSTFELINKLRLDSLYSKNTTLLNDENPTDRVIYSWSSYV